MDLCLICDHNNALVLSCKHKVCVDCVINLYSGVQSTKCPACQTTIIMDDIVKLNICARCKSTECDYCQDCSNFLCCQCWSVIHSFKPLIYHTKSSYETPIVERKNILIKLEQFLSDLKQIDDDLMNIKNDNVKSSIKQETLDDVRKIYRDYHVILDEQLKTIEHHIEEQTTLKIQSMLNDKLRTRDYIEWYKNKVFEHKDFDEIETQRYIRNLTYQLSINKPTLPQIVSIGNVETPEVKSIGIIPSNEVQEWKQNGLSVRICPNGRQEWYKDGLLHRENDLPAVIHADGTREWYKDGQRHRDHDLPAIIHSNGKQMWYLNGLKHRDNDGPSVVYPNGTQKWYYKGLKHRPYNRPAIIKTDGTQKYYYFGKLHSYSDLPAVVYPDGKQLWYLNGVLHRDNLPAIIHPNNEEEFYSHGIRKSN